MDQSPHILIVDDDREIRDLLVKFFEKHQLRVTAVRDAQEARRVWAGGNFNLVVLDLMLSRAVGRLQGRHPLVARERRCSDRDAHRDGR